MIKRGDLIAFADDILIQSSSLAELSTVLKAFDIIGSSSGLTLNKSKCQLILAHGAEVEG